MVTRVLSIKVKPGAKRNEIKETSGIIKASVTAPAHDGKANEAVIALLAEHFGIKKANIAIIKGATSRNKLIRIDR